MATSSTGNRTFAHKLRAELDRQDLGVRTLARKLSDDKHSLEIVRRRLNKYLRDGVVPTEATRHEIEAALGTDRDALNPDDDDDEDDEEALVRARLATAVLPLVDVLLELTRLERRKAEHAATEETRS
jgi:hypothetical protein